MKAIKMVLKINVNTTITMINVVWLASAFRLQRREKETYKYLIEDNVYVKLECWSRPHCLSTYQTLILVPAKSTIYTSVAA